MENHVNYGKPYLSNIILTTQITVISFRVLNNRSRNLDTSQQSVFSFIVFKWIEHCAIKKFMPNEVDLNASPPTIKYMHIALTAVDFYSFSLQITRTVASLASVTI